ncbi:MAG: hypothetical protein AABX24_04565 [Nanoarchaeota archaeon]
MIAEIIIENTRRIGAVTVTLDYSIEDESGENFFTELETKTISDKISYLKKIELPEDLEPGKYQLLVKLKYEDDIALAGYSFEVIGEEELPLFGRAASVVSGKTIRSYSLYAIGFIFVLLIIFSLVYWRKRRSFPHLNFIRREKL